MFTQRPDSFEASWDADADVMDGAQCDRDTVGSLLIEMRESVNVHVATDSCSSMLK